MDNNNFVTEMDNIFGIDLGTSNCCVAVWNNGTYKIITDDNKNRTFPSTVCIKNEIVYVGKEIQNEDIESNNVYYNVKRILGKNYEEIERTMKNTLFNITNVGNNVLLNGTYYPEEIISKILIKIKQNICNFMNYPDDTEIQTVITIPAYFNDSQRQATKDAIKIAGLKCLKLLNEPTAAAIAYGYEKRYEHDGVEHIIMVYDMGGGTTDVSILNVCDGVFEVLASVGNTTLGGIDFDNILVNYCLDCCNKQISDISKQSLLELKNNCENVKINISKKEKFIINFEKNEIEINQSLFHSLSEPLLFDSIKPIIESIQSCNLTLDDIEDVILVGAATKLKILQNKIKTLFNKELVCNINPDEVVAIGAAIQGHILTKKTDPFTNNIVLLDITPLSLGVETMGGIMDIVIKRNTIIPITQKKRYTNDTDFITSISIKIFEGERQFTKDNNFLGELILSNLKPVPKCCSDIDVIFKIDSNGIISVTAHEINDNIVNNLDISLNKGRLSDEEIENIINVSSKMKNDDEINKKNVYLKSTILNYFDILKNKIDNDEKLISLINTFNDNDTNENYLSLISFLEKKYNDIIFPSNCDLTNEYEEINEINENNEIKEEKNEIKEENIEQMKDEFLEICQHILDCSETMTDYVNGKICWFYSEEQLTCNKLRIVIIEMNEKFKNSGINELIDMCEILGNFLKNSENTQYNCHLNFFIVAIKKIIELNDDYQKELINICDSQFKNFTINAEIFDNKECEDFKNIITDISNLIYDLII